MRARRRKLGLTQEELAEASGLHIATVQKVEQGGDASMRTYHLLARALGVETMWFSDPATPEPIAARRDELALGAMRAAISPPVGLSGRPLVGAPDRPDLARLGRAVGGVARAYHGDDYDKVSELVPTLIHSAHQHVAFFDGGDDGRAALRLRADILGLAGRYLIQVREHDLAVRAAQASLRDALEVEDMPLAAAAISSQAWAMMRQGRLDEVEALCLETAEQVEPTMSTATPDQLSAWGYLLLRAAGAASRNNKADKAREYVALAHTGGVRLGRQVDDLAGHRAFGPLTTGLAQVETELLDERPDGALTLAERLPRGVGEASTSSWNRHRIAVSDALVRTGQADRATGVLTELRRRHPQWLRQQQYGRDVVSALLDTVPRTLTDDQRVLADFMGVAG